MHKCINVKGIVYPKIIIMPSVMVFYLYTIIYSKVVLNLSEFLSILRNKENQTVAGPRDFPDSPKYLILCSAHERNEYRFGTT